MSFSLSIDMSAFESEMEQFADRAEKAARPAAQAGAQVLYDRVKANVAALGRKTGNLDSSIYQAFSESNSNESKPVYHISWNYKEAPHGHLLEFGYLQRYLYYQNNQGQIRPMVRPGMEGMPRPGRRASREQKDAYFMTRPGGPVQVPGSAFLRRAKDAMPQAQEAMRKTFLERLNER